MSDPMTFGHYLRTLRTAANLSQRALAERLGVTPAHVAHIEQGARRALAERHWPALVAIGADLDTLRRLAARPEVAALHDEIDRLRAQLAGSALTGVV
jgi:transcriptional regulator with XRE-family HTH domain